MITNYKINQPFTSDLSVEEGEKNSSRTWNHGAGRIVNHVETFFTQKAEKSVEGKPYSRNTVRANSFRSGQIFFLVPFKESRFPLFGISIQAGKRSSRSITERSCGQGLISFTKHKRPISSEDLEVLQQISWVWMLQKVFQIWHVLTPFSTSEREAVKTNARWNPVTFSSKQQQAGWSTSSQARERRKISPPSSATDFTHSVFHRCEFSDG